jgi:hypothetical protein
MSTLKVLQSYPSLRKALLAALGSAETCDSGTIMLDMIDLKPRLPYHVAFQIVVAYTTKKFTQNFSTRWLMRDMRDVVGVLEGH